VKKNSLEQDHVKWASKTIRIAEKAKGNGNTKSSCRAEGRGGLTGARVYRKHRARHRVILETPMEKKGGRSTAEAEG